MKRLIFTIFAAMMFASCIKDSPQTPPDGEVSLRIEPTVVETGMGDIGVMTRAKVDGAFPLGATIGLGISASTPIASFYDNFYGLNGGDAWRYYLGNVNTGTILSGFSSWGNISLYGYYPYDPAATDLSTVPFSIATLNGGVAEGSETTALTDYMVAGTMVKDMAIPSPSGALNLEFGHMMTAIELFINRNTVGSISQPILKLGSVTFEIVAGTREFVVSGTYNALNPDMTNLQNNINAAGRTTATRMTVTYPSSPNITYNTTAVARQLVIMPELRHNGSAGNGDATVRMTFSFFDQDGSPYLLEDIAGGNPSIEFDLSDITNSGTSDMGLLAGYSYGIQATIGTYTHFSAPTTGTPTPPHVNYTPLEDADEDEFIDI